MADQPIMEWDPDAHGGTGGWVPIRRTATLGLASAPASVIPPVAYPTQPSAGYLAQADGANLTHLEELPPPSGVPHPMAPPYPAHQGYPASADTSDPFDEVPTQPGNPGDPRAETAPGPAKGGKMLAALLVVLLLGGGVTYRFWRDASQDGSTGDRVASAATSSAQPLPDRSTPPAGNGESVPPSTPVVAEQADAVNELLDETTLTRAAVIAAVNEIGACRNAGLHAAELRDAAATRARLAGAVGALSFDQVPDGEQMQADLREAMALSGQADLSFASWGDEVAAIEPCSMAPSTADRADAAAMSAQARAAKQRFLARWNPIAEWTGLPTRTYLQI